MAPRAGEETRGRYQKAAAVIMATSASAGPGRIVPEVTE